jgi:predicted secreted Zn-dependent protease
MPEILISIMKHLICIFGLLTFFLSASASYGIVYQYFDEDGTLIVTDDPHGLKKHHKAPPLPAPAPPKGKKAQFMENIYYEYYPVSGLTYKDLVHSSNSSGPFDPEEKKNYPAQTRLHLGWSYNFNYTYQEEADGSHVYVSAFIYDIDFRPNITVVLPVPSGSELNPFDSSLWDRYIDGLLEHEHDHVKIIKDPALWEEAKNAVSMIKELTIYRDPQYELKEQIRAAVEAETAKIGHDLLYKIKIRNNEYDRLTEHGLKKEMRGVFFGR